MSFGQIDSFPHHVWGISLVLGDSEDIVVVTARLADSGLRYDHGIVVVLDGSKAPRGLATAAHAEPGVHATRRGISFLTPTRVAAST